MIRATRDSGFLLCMENHDTMTLKNVAALAMMMIAFSSCNKAQNTQTNTNNTKHSATENIAEVNFKGLDGETLRPLQLTADEWQEKLTSNEFYVLRQAGTERAFTGDLWDNKKEGVYTCAGCDLPLFSSSTKFKSGTGWPSFFEPIREGHIVEKADNTHGMTRIEVLCGRCGGHQGHVFNDGPRPTGLRYCINSVSMNFEEGASLEEEKP